MLEKKRVYPPPTTLCLHHKEVFQENLLMMNAMTKRLGGAAVLAKVEIPKVKPGYVLVKNHFAGINFIDLYHRNGLYPLEDNTILGAEAGGIVVQESPEVANPQWLHQRVVFFDLGGFAEYTLVPISRLIPVPQNVDIPVALAMTTMGLTAHYLCTSIGKLKPNDSVLVHAAGSGTGQLVAQIACNVFHARVVGTSSLIKIENIPLPREQRVSSYTDSRLILSANGGNKFDLVIDGVGKDSFQTSLACCKSRGLVVFFGNASGPVPPLDLLKDLTAHGSLFVTRPKLHDYVATHEELLQRAAEVFQWLDAGLITILPPKQFSGLEHVNEALDFVQARLAMSKVVVSLL